MKGVLNLNDFQTTLFDEQKISPPINPAPPGRAAEKFACCSRYRQCSEAGHCVNKIEGLAENCSYNENLKSGKIFYSKKANYFDENVYGEIAAKYQGFSSVARREFDRYLYYFYKQKYLARWLVCYKDPAQKEIFESGLIKEWPGFSYLVGFVKVSVLKDMYSYLDEAYEKWFQTEKSRRGGTLGYRGFLLSRFRDESSNFDASPLTSKFSVLSLNTENNGVQYLGELVQDFAKLDDASLRFKMPKEFLSEMYSYYYPQNSKQKKQKGGEKSDE
jgi:hypothetical protein